MRSLLGQTELPVLMTGAHKFPFWEGAPIYAEHYLAVLLTRTLLLPHSPPRRP